jgi:hypothetical protein
MVLKISASRKHEEYNANKINYYKIELLHNVDELLEYKIKKGFNFEDNDGIFIKPSTIDGYQFKYSNMIDLNRAEHTREYDESDEDSE